MRKMKYVKLFENFSINEGKLDPQYCQKQNETIKNILNNLFILAGSNKQFDFWKIGQGYIPSTFLKECEKELQQKADPNLIKNQIGKMSDEFTAYGTQFKNCINLLRSMNFIGDKRTNTLYIQFLQDPNDKGMSYQEFKKYFNTGLSEEEQSSFLNQFNEEQGTNFEKLGSIFLSRDGKGRTDDEKYFQDNHLHQTTYYSLLN